MRPALVFVLAAGAAFYPAAQTATAQTASPALKIVRPVISASDDGPPLETVESFQPGEDVFFSFQVEGYRINALRKVQLTAHIQAFDSRNTPIVPVDEEVIGTTLSTEDKDWKPKIRSQIVLPAIAPPGPWTIKFDVTDQESHQTVSGQIRFSVRGEGVDPSPELAIRSFGFYRAQNDPMPLHLAAYQPGDMIWVRFFMTGYKYGEQNAIDVTYDVTIEGPGGRQLFHQEDAAEEKSQAFYPQPWVPAEFSLTLQDNTSPGTYLMTVTAHDNIGHQMATFHGDFRVEK
jgi:hypothetical protein